MLLKRMRKLVSRGGFLAPAMGLLLALAAALPAQAQDPTAMFRGQAENPEAWVQEVASVLSAGGVEPMMLHLRNEVDNNLNLAPLRQAALAANDGKPIEILVPYHEHHANVITFANRQLALSGMDFFVFKGVISPELPDPFEPPASEAELYVRWGKIRDYIGPYMGVAVVLLAAGGEVLKQQDHLSLGVAATTLFSLKFIVPAVSVCIAKFGLEKQFGKFSKWYQKYFWDPQVFIPVPGADAQVDAHGRPTGAAVAAATQKSTLRQWIHEQFFNKTQALGKGIVTSVNWLVRVTRAELMFRHTPMKLGIALNAFVNMMYVSTIYVAYWVGKKIVGDTVDKKFSETMYNGLETTGIFMGVFGIPQYIMGRLRARGQINETLRFKIESMSLGFANVGRGLSTFPGMEFSGKILQFIAGALFAVPIYTKASLASNYSRATGDRFQAQIAALEAEAFQEERRNPVATFCDATLGNVFGTLSKFWSWKAPLNSVAAGL